MSILKTLAVRCILDDDCLEVSDEYFFDNYYGMASEGNLRQINLQLYTISL